MIVEALEIAVEEGRVTTRSEMGKRERYIYLRISEEEATMLLFQPSFLTIQREGEDIYGHQSSLTARKSS